MLLLGDRVYKIKKPVRTGFLDFRDRATRDAVCTRETELGRRLAPDVYLGVTHLTDPATGDHEPLVVMARMPEHTRLSTLADTEPDPLPAVHAIADRIAAFHATADRGPHIDIEGTATALHRRWQDNLHETRHLDQHLLDPDRLDRLDHHVTRYLDGRTHLFDDRITDHRIIDGHGDLLADDIFCLPDGPRILDCLEFDDHLRYLDGLDDIACLAMDLEHLGHPDLADALLTRYTTATDDPAPASLRHHYIAYRAFMRAKVDCIRYLQGHTTSAADALHHTDLTEHHLNLATVRLALVGGPPATGKSTVARALAARTGATLLSSDTLRRTMFTDQRRTDPHPAYRTGRYSPDATDRVYRTLLDQARHHLQRGTSVVLDASFTDPRHRRHATDLADDTHTDLVQLRCTAPPDVIEHRLHERAGGDHDSEATPDIARALAAHTTPWPDATTLDTTGDDAVPTALTHWNRPHRTPEEAP
ncbi:bifunctional aminoglycoside phosphotransferase/ATP-binding protein [Prescottella subtropica]|uniref:bifunctional aminoglycoside phosphotransferase/ATP-binding protein n=1 Tax=Prescottella subtropica TaxID=2545757 RepID=UPI0010F4BC50|nr:bifunctional aminoglycoside phosphotransferase/ATP-binding protein [Prescottella subtropica]